MIASMTGFGKGVSEGGVGRVTVEVRAVNGRYGDVSIHMPRSLVELEPRIKDQILESITRGRIDVTLTLQGSGADQGIPILRTDVLAGYQRGIEAMQSALGVTGDVDLMRLAALPQVFAFEASDLDLEAFWDVASEALRMAIEHCRAMQLAEGKRLAEDFEHRIGLLDGMVDRVEALAPGRVTSVKQRLEEKLAQLLTPEQVDEQRLMMEVALLAERSDITEECVRFRSHNAQFLDMLNRQLI